MKGRLCVGAADPRRAETDVCAPCLWVALCLPSVVRLAAVEAHTESVGTVNTINQMSALKHTTNAMHPDTLHIRHTHMHTTPQIHANSGTQSESIKTLGRKKMEMGNAERKKESMKNKRLLRQDTPKGNKVKYKCLACNAGKRETC